ncbi:hypothetical protein D3C76_763980 [compost metagenome]
MRGTAQACFDSPQDDRHVFPCFFTTLGVDQSGAIRTLARDVIGGISIIVTQFAIGGIAVDHRVHVPGGDAEKQVRFAEAPERLFAVPVWLRNDPNSEALRLQHTATDGHAEARVIDVRIARHQNNVAAVPAQLVHLFAGHRQEWRRSKAGRPVLGPGEEVSIRLDQGYCAHNASEEKINKGRGLYAGFIR